MDCYRMIDYIKNFCLYIVIGLIFYSTSVWLQSDFLSKYMDENLITLLVALLAINTTTISVIMTKLRDITEKNKVDFTKTIKALRVSIIEQVIILAIAAVMLLLKSSIVIKNAWIYAEFVLNVLLIATFVWAIHVLYDTANGVFVILKHENLEQIKDSGTIQKK